MTASKQEICDSIKNNLKDKVAHIVCVRNLCSYMNNIKWDEFITAVKNNMPFPPPFCIKFITENTVIQGGIEKGNVSYWGDWSEEGIVSKEFYFNIEWIKVRPCYLKYRGKLVEPELVDESKKFEEILQKTNIPYEEEKGLYCIYGYR